MQHVEYLNLLRRVEMDEVAPLLPPGCRVLDFGSGTGQQASYLADLGFDVTAIDLATSVYRTDRIYPVQEYDGRHIPLDDASVDAIFSSNVLEHVEDLSTILSEFRRVLAPGGIAIHVLPTPAWRLLTFGTALLRSGITAARLPARLAKPPPELTRLQVLRSDARRIASGFIPRGHGTSPEGISELWTFSPRAWRHRFAANGFVVVTDRPVRLFYTGNLLFGDRLAISTRARFSRYLGSATHLYQTRVSTSASNADSSTTDKDELIAAQPAGTSPELR
jgi:SAM-dependent methyltransferase